MPPPDRKDQNVVTPTTQDQRQASLEEFAALRRQLGAAAQAHPEDIETAKNYAKKASKGPVATKRRLIQAAVDVREEKTTKPTAYVHPCFWLLPHKDPGFDEYGKHVTIWDVGDARLKLRIQADPDYGLPYGFQPRVIMAVVLKSAIQTGSREIDLGRHQKSFLEDAGIHNNGRQIRVFKNQMSRLFFSIMTIVQTYKSDNKDRASYHRINIFDHSDAELDYWQGKEGAKWPEKLVMSEQFYEAARKTPVPIALNIIQSLSKSPLAVDLYMWLSYRMYRLSWSKNPVTKIPWTELQKEFGAGYPNTSQGLRNFKKKFTQALKSVEVLYHQAQGHIHPERDYLKLTPARIAKPLKSA